MRFITNLTSLLPAALLVTSAFASAASAQSTSAPQSGPQSAPRYELRPFVGAYLPAGDQSDLLDEAATLGAQGAINLTDRVSLVGTLGWSRSSDKTLLFNDEVDLFQYDVGAEFQQPFATGNGMTLSPFVGLGMGGRTYDYRDRATDAETNFAGYGSLGAQLRVGTVGLRLEARDYLSQFQGLTGDEDSKTRNDVTIMSAVTLAF